MASLHADSITGADGSSTSDVRDRRSRTPLAASEHVPPAGWARSRYPQHQKPLAVYAPAVDKTFFVFAGVSGKKSRLSAVAGLFDPATGMLARPSLVNIRGTNDAHANAAMNIGPKGHIHVYAAARHNKIGHVLRSTKPYDISSFDMFFENVYIPYTQGWITDQGQHFLKFTKYTGGREIYSTTSADGLAWNLAGTCRSCSPLPSPCPPPRWRRSVVGSSVSGS